MSLSSRAKKSKRITADQRLIRATLDLIEKNGGCRGVNLRQIAAKARCAHTNAYNYFDSLEELLWAALEKAMKDALDEIANAEKQCAPDALPLEQFLRSQVLFAQMHPSLYRLFWLEPLAGRPPKAVLEGLILMRSTWVRLIASQLASKKTPDDLAWAGQIIHGYFHGEVCKLIGRHAFAPRSDDDCKRIVSNTLSLVEIIDRCPKKNQVPTQRMRTNKRRYR